MGDLALEPARLDGGHHPALGLDLGEEAFGLPLEPVGKRLDEVGAAQRIGDAGHARLIG